MRIDYEIKNNPIESLLRRLFFVIKVNNYHNDIRHLSDYLIPEIKKFIFKYNHMEYLFIGDQEKSIVDMQLEEKLISSERYSEMSSELFSLIEYRLIDFCKVNKNKDLYRDDDYSLEEKKEFILNSLRIVQRQICNLPDKDIYEEIYDNTLKIEGHLDDDSELEAYEKILEKSGLNFVCESRNHEMFYPVIVDMFLDYAVINDIIYTNKWDIKTRTKRYPKFKEKIMNKSYEDFNDSYFEIVRFVKKGRKENRKRHILKFYLEQFGDNEAIYTLFRKLYLNSLGGDGKFTFSNMKGYTPKTHNFFLMGANTINFI